MTIMMLTVNQCPFDDSYKHQQHFGKGHPKSTKLSGKPLVGPQAKIHYIIFYLECGIYVGYCLL